MTRLARYQPPHIPTQWLVGVVVIFACLSLARGLDYATSARAGQSMVVLNALGNIRLWGVIVIVGALNVLATYALRRHFLIWLAHVIAAAIQLCIAVTVAQSILELGVGGWAAFAPPFGAFVWHLFMLWLTGPFPRPGAGHGS